MKMQSLISLNKLVIMVEPEQPQQQEASTKRPKNTDSNLKQQKREDRSSQKFMQHAVRNRINSLKEHLAEIKQKVESFNQDGYNTDRKYDQYYNKNDNIYMSKQDSKKIHYLQVPSFHKKRSPNKKSQQQKQRNYGEHSHNQGHKIPSREDANAYYNNNNSQNPNQQKNSNKNGPNQIQTERRKIELKQDQSNKNINSFPIEVELVQDSIHDNNYKGQMHKVMQKQKMKLQQQKQRLTKLIHQKQRQLYLHKIGKQDEGMLNIHEQQYVVKLYTTRVPNQELLHNLPKLAKLLNEEDWLCCKVYTNPLGLVFLSLPNLQPIKLAYKQIIPRNMLVVGRYLRICTQIDHNKRNLRYFVIQFTNQNIASQWNHFIKLMTANFQSENINQKWQLLLYSLQILQQSQKQEADVIVRQPPQARKEELQMQSYTIKYPKQEQPFQHPPGTKKQTNFALKELPQNSPGKQLQKSKLFPPELKNSIKISLLKKQSNTSSIFYLSNSNSNHSNSYDYSKKSPKQVSNQLEMRDSLVKSKQKYKQQQKNVNQNQLNKMVEEGQIVQSIRFQMITEEERKKLNQSLKNQTKLGQKNQGFYKKQSQPNSINIPNLLCDSIESPKLQKIQSLTAMTVKLLDKLQQKKKLLSQSSSSKLGIHWHENPDERPSQIQALPLQTHQSVQASPTRNQNKKISTPTSSNKMRSLSKRQRDNSLQSHNQANKDYKIKRVESVTRDKSNSRDSSHLQFQNKNRKKTDFSLQLQKVQMLQRKKTSKNEIRDHYLNRLIQKQTIKQMSKSSSKASTRKQLNMLIPIPERLRSRKPTQSAFSNNSLSQEQQSPDGEGELSISQSSSRNERQSTQQQIKLQQLKNGIVLQKCSKNSWNPKQKRLYISNSMTQLCYCDNHASSSPNPNEKKIFIRDIKSIQLGVVSKGIYRHKKRIEQGRCMLIRVNHGGKQKLLEFYLPEGMDANGAHHQFRGNAYDNGVEILDEFARKLRGVIEQINRHAESSDG